MYTFCINSNSIAPVLCCAEPTSSSAPRFASESYGFVLRKSSGMAFNLLCPAQAFPAPLFRYTHARRIAGSPYPCRSLDPAVNVDSNFNVVIYIEPTSSSAPRLTGEFSLVALKRLQGSSSTLTCLAQGFPAPAFR